MSKAILSIFPFQVPIVGGTINRGGDSVGAGLVANDWIGFCGSDSTSTEIALAEAVLKLGEGSFPSSRSGLATNNVLRTAMIESAM